MKQFIDSVIASVFFLILMLLGETLQFLPSGSTPFLTCVYGAELFFVSWVLMYRSKNTVEVLDFFVSAVILGVQFLILGGRLILTNGAIWGLRQSLRRSVLDATAASATGFIWKIAVRSREIIDKIAYSYKIY